MQFKSYHKIKQFKDVVSAIQHKSDFRGLDENGDAIYETSEKPILTFTGTVKLHGTNSGICYSPEEGVVAQKRSSLLNPENLDAHMGFNAFVKVEKKDEIEELMANLWQQFAKQGDKQIILYGEWAGKGIQKGVAITQLKKQLYIFDFAILDAENNRRWVSASELPSSNIEDIHNVYDFKTYSIDIDFNNPAEAQNKLIEITQDVEKECPVSKQLGIEGTGEGVVWTTYWQGNKYIFKVKGEKHSSSKVKKPASIDPEVLENIAEFVEYACTENRMEQAIQETGAKEKKDTPDYLRWIANDIIEEESDVLESNNLTWKDVAKPINQKARTYFFNKVDKVS